MPAFMPTPIPPGSIQCIEVPDFLNECRPVHLTARAIFIFKTAAFDRSATPPEQ
jgi:hypothetical protein